MPQTNNPNYLTDTQKFYRDIKASLLETPRQTSNHHRIYLCFALRQVLGAPMGANEPLRGECTRLLETISTAFNQRTIEDYLISECGLTISMDYDLKQLIYKTRQSILTSVIQRGADACQPLKILKQTVEEQLPKPLSKKVVEAINAERYWRGK